MKTTHLPLFLNYRFPVVGKNYFAGVTLKGRLLLELEGGEWWAYGINPGGISAFADSKEGALAAFTTRLHEVVNDLAGVAETFEEFETEMRASFKTNEEYLKLWQSALKGVRDGVLDDPSMNRESGDNNPALNVEKIAKPNPTVNFDKEFAVAHNKAA